MFSSIRKFIILGFIVLLTTAATPYRDQPSFTQMGTGFFVNESGIVMTAAHVVQFQGMEEVLAGSMTGDINITFNGLNIPAHIIVLDPAHDVAILQMEGVLKTPYVYLNPYDVTIGDTITTWGYGEPGTFNETLLPKVDTVIGIHQIAPGINSDSIVGQGALLHGDSGAPTFDKQNQVVGIGDYGIDGINGYSRIEYGINLLHSKGLYYYTENFLYNWFGMPAELNKSAIVLIKVTPKPLPDQPKVIIIGTIKHK